MRFKALTDQDRDSHYSPLSSQLMGLSVGQASPIDETTHPELLEMSRKASESFRIKCVRRRILSEDSDRVVAEFEDPDGKRWVAKTHRDHDQYQREVLFTRALQGPGTIECIQADDKHSTVIFPMIDETEGDPKDYVDDFFHLLGRLHVRGSFLASESLSSDELAELREDWVAGIQTRLGRKLGGIAIGDHKPLNYLCDQSTLVRIDLETLLWHAPAVFDFFLCVDFFQFSKPFKVEFSKFFDRYLNGVAVEEERTGFIKHGLTCEVSSLLKELDAIAEVFGFSSFASFMIQADLGSRAVS